jgi:hypothetical protein
MRSAASALVSNSSAKASSRPDVSSTKGTHIGAPELRGGRPALEVECTACWAGRAQSSPQLAQELPGGHVLTLPDTSTPADQSRIVGGSPAFRDRPRGLMCRRREGSTRADAAEADSSRHESRP